MRRNRTIGFTLIETVMTVGLVGLAFPLATSLIRISLRADRRFADSRDAKTKFDGAIDALRRDVWSANALSMAGDHTLTIGRVGGELIRWTSKSDGTLERQQKHESTRNWSLGLWLHFRADGSTLGVSSSPPDGSSTGIAITLISQPLAAGKDVP